MTKVGYFDNLHNNHNFFSTTVGFDDLLKKIESYNKDFTARGKFFTFPFYNIKKLEENKYVIELALAGYTKQNIDISLDKNILSISGKMEEDNDNVEYIHKGLTNKTFTRNFTLDDYVEVNSAEFVNGILSVYLEKVIPPEKLPKKIDIIIPKK